MYGRYVFSRSHSNTDGSTVSLRAALYPSLLSKTAPDQPLVVTAPVGTKSAKTVKTIEKYRILALTNETVDEKILKEYTGLLQEGGIKARPSTEERRSKVM